MAKCTYRRERQGGFDYGTGTGLSEVEERMRQIAREVVGERTDLLRKEIMEG
ncbi:MAG: hypothetical protein ACP5SI_08585 [Chloroflexia bacterium]